MRQEYASQFECACWLVFFAAEHVEDRSRKQVNSMMRSQFGK